MKISKFNNEELSQIRLIWSVDCPEIEYIPTNSTCKTHNIKHDRLPDVNTWNKLNELFPFATLQAWADAFYVSRESIRQLNLLEKSKNTLQGINVVKNNPDQHKIVNYFGERPVKELFDKFFDLYFNFPNKGLDKILDFIGMDKAYFYYWIDNDEILYIEYKNAKEKRKKKKRNPSYLKCYKCKKIKLPNEFGKNESTKSKISNVCKICNSKSKEIKRAIQDRTSNAYGASSKNCLMCGKTKNLRSFRSDDGKESLLTYCLSCSARRRDSRMREKISKLGVEDYDRTCISCNKLCGVEDFYLIRGFQIRDNPVPKPFLTEECRRCVYNLVKDYPTLREIILSRWRNELRKIGSENYIVFNDFLNSYLKTVKKDLKIKE